jgi:hypothetical protein
MEDKMKKHLSLVSLAFFVSFILSACGSGQLFGPTLTPTPTLTPKPTLTPVPPTATPQSGPNVGHWEGDQSVSFEIRADGKIHNFEMEIDSGGNGSCMLTADVIPIDSDGTFQYTFGETIKEGVNTVNGKFESDDTLSGTRSGAIRCTDSSGQILVLLSLEDVPISAEWKGQ